MSESTLGVAKCSENYAMKEVKQAIERAAGLLSNVAPDGRVLDESKALMPLLLIGPPGVGKTIRVRGLVDEVNLSLIERGIKNSNGQQRKLGFKAVRVGQHIIGDLTGLPYLDGETGKKRVKRSPMSELPIEEIDGEYGVLFLDEITTASVQQIQPALGLADGSRSISGDYKLPDHWLVIGAGNGPECSNFQRLDDMTINRFRVFNLEFNYETDWRQYAINTSIDPLIIAFLDFKNEWAHNQRDKDDREDELIGEQFASPRSWEALSNAFLDAMIKNRWKQVPDDIVFMIANTIIGERAASELSAFAAFRTTANYDVDKIMAGTERDPDEDIETEAVFLIKSALESKIRIMSQNPEHISIDANANAEFSLDIAKALGNTMTWLIKLSTISHSLELAIGCIADISVGIPNISKIMADVDFVTFCPMWEDFIVENGDTIIGYLPDSEEV